MDEFVDDDRGEIGKRLALLAVFLFGCGCWVAVGHRHWDRMNSPNRGELRSENADWTAEKVASAKSRQL